MSEKLSHDQYVLSVRHQIVKTAQAMLDGELSYLQGARKLPQPAAGIDGACLLDLSLRPVLVGA